MNETNPFSFTSVWIKINIWNFTCLNCRAWYEDMTDLHSHAHTIYKQLWNWRLKKFQDWTGFKPMTSAIPVQYSTNWAIRPSRSPATLRVRKLLYNTPRGWRKEANIWNFIHLDCREWYEDVIDHPSYANNSSSCEIKVLKKWPTPRCRSFIKIFSRGATGFHWQEKPFWIELL